MRVLVTHHRWGYGGGEAVFYYTVKALASAGFEIVMSTIDSPDFKSYIDVVGEPLRGNVTFVKALSVNTKMLTLYKPLVSLKCANLKSFDAIIVTHGYPFIFFNKIEAPIIYYMHFPSVLKADILWNPELSKYELKSPSKSGLREFLNSIPWWLYFQPYKLVLFRLYEPLVRVFSRILVNSSYTLRAFKYSLLRYTKLSLGEVREVLSRTRILYPPLPRAGELLELRGSSRVPCVATIGRFSSEKRYDVVLEVARLMPDTLFIVAGGVYGRASRAYYEWVKSRAPGNVRVLANIPSSVKHMILSKCTAYLHTMPGEHFGIAPLEAAAAGMTPVVHTRSGTWTDVCREGEYCYSYITLNPREVAEAVERALEKPRIAPVEHVDRFSPERFMKEIVRIVEEVTGSGDTKKA